MNVQEELHKGIALARQGKFAEAVAVFGNVVQRDPTCAAAHYNLGRALKDLGCLNAAIESYQRSVELQPEFLAAWLNLANTLFRCRKIREAADTYKRVLTVAPALAEPRFYLGVSQQRLGDHAEAISSFKQATAVDPGKLEWWQTLAAALHNAGRLEEAVHAYNQILRLSPKDVSARYSLGIIDLAKGDFEAGWQAYELRRHLPSFRTMRSFPQPEWNGEPIDKKRILIHAEQGLGDTIQFIRYVPEVTSRAATATLICPQSLVRVFTSRFGLSAVIPDGSALPEFDVHVPLMSLPRIFGTRLHTIPATLGYIRPAAEDEELFRTETTVQEPKVGLCWSGNPENPTDPVRSASLRSFEPITSAIRGSFFSLQTGEAAKQMQSAKLGLIELHAQFTDLSRTAALISKLDLVISVDTVVAHLAAALGKPTWLLIAYACDWRWALDRRDSPWYPSMRIFRQPALGDWDSVAAEVARELKEFRWKR